MFFSFLMSKTRFKRASCVTLTLQPRNFRIAQANAGSVRATDDSINTEVQIVVGQHACVASRIEAVAGHILAVQIVQVGTLEYFVVASIVGYLNTLIAYEYADLVITLKQVILNFVQQSVATVFSVLRNRLKYDQNQ